VALPKYFGTTTLRAVVATGEQDEAHVRDVANRFTPTLRLGEGHDADVAARTFVELVARATGTLRIVDGSADRRDEFERLARDINPRIEFAQTRANGTAVSVAINSRTEADVSYAGAGWWVGPGGAVDQAGAFTLGPTCAGILAFNEAFKLGYASVLPAPSAKPVAGPGWSLLDFSARGAAQEDLVLGPDFELPWTALIGCGAIGQSVAFTLGEIGIRGGPLDLVDPQTVSTNNLQRYLGSRMSDAVQHLHKVLVARRQLPSALGVRSFAGEDWAGYRRRVGDVPPVVLSALDSATDRRMLQGSLPRWIINGWTRTTSCGTTVHAFVGDEQCLVCTYLSRDPAGSTNDMRMLADDLGLEPMRVVALLSGSSLHSSDVSRVERHRKLTPGSLERWRGESIRQLYGHLCGIAEIPTETREHYVVPFAQASALAGVLVTAQYLKIASGRPVDARPVDVDLLGGPGAVWQLPPARKDQHPVRCICEDPAYLDAYAAKWYR
jgi:ThiF family protein